MNLWPSSLFFDIIRWIVFFIEFLLARFVYRTIRNRDQSRKQLVELQRLLSSSQLEIRSTVTSQNTEQLGTCSYPISLSHLKDQLSPMAKGFSNQFAMGTCVANVFLSVLLGMSYLMQPITYRIVPKIVPLTILLILIPLPYLLDLKPSTTLLLLIGSFGLCLLLLLQI